MSSVKTRLAVVGVIKFVADIQQVKMPFVRNYTYFKTFPEQINEIDHFVRTVASVSVECKYAGGWGRK